MIAWFVAVFNAWRERRAFRRLSHEVAEMEQYMRGVVGRDVERGKLPPGMWD